MVPTLLLLFVRIMTLYMRLVPPISPNRMVQLNERIVPLKDMMNAMLVSSGLPDNIWGEAILTTCFILNRVPHKKLDQTPYELWKGCAPI